MRHVVPLPYPLSCPPPHPPRDCPDFTCPSFILLCILSFLFSFSLCLFSLLTCVQLVITPCVQVLVFPYLSLSVWLLCFPHLRPVFLVFPVHLLSAPCFCISLLLLFFTSLVHWLWLTLSASCVFCLFLAVLDFGHVNYSLRDYL